MNVKSLKSNTSNVWMFHRIKMLDNCMSDIYRERGMLHTIEELFCLIDTAIMEGYKFGSINEAIHCNKTVHLTFDDGYKEHLSVAKELKKRYDFSYNCITFAINIRNSFYEDKLCMDMLYQLIDKRRLNDMKKIFNIKSNNIELKELKKIFFSTTQYIEEINKYVDMQNYFLDKEEVIALSKLFSIASHCINHCYLTSLSDDDMYIELKVSKAYLSTLLNKEIEIICYPEGNHSNVINKVSKELGYKFGFSIFSKDREPKEFNINRSIPKCI
ncbi:MAG: Unknown protein [uncultured Sulfurovum sp.]|uniref:NodB homology domain-containing protein n=1 Tax=uncultured Sulfurovum sp. TaxID=269237 RepID=A0A6S6SA80_9BACT|nr:MAG: Unknown protein [uncultured Sulfurovum sp.]